MDVKNISALLISACLIACSPAGLNLITQLEARSLKADAVTKIRECADDHSTERARKNCSDIEVARLISAHCENNIRETEPIYQEDCEDFVWRIVMKPDSFFRDDKVADEFPGARRRTGECETVLQCQVVCDDIFRSGRDRDACEEYSIAAVNRMNAVFEVLENPTAPDLQDMDTEDLDMLLDISPMPLETAVGRMNQSEKKIFLAWLATDSEVTEIIESAEDDFAIIKELFGTTQSAIIAELNRNIDSGDTFVEIILTEGNDVALEWLHDFFGDQCDNDNNYEKCVFKNYYCRLNLDSDAEDEYFGFDSFESVLDEVLETERKTSGAPSWWDTNTEARDLDSWQSSPHNVCTNMKP